MKPNELRIGNTLTSKTWLGYHRVDGIERIDDEIFEVKTKGYVHRHEKGTWFELVPIPLTEELLLKLGFERIDSGRSEDHEDSHQWLEKVYPIIGCVYSGDGDYVFCEKFDDQRIYSLHQLQNFYFAITGEELEIKL